jgi:WD40 repeat protein/serine/threonine protein kinase
LKKIRFPLRRAAPFSRTISQRPETYGPSIMDPRSIDRIFWDAAQIVAAEERQAYLDSACAGDTELRQKVEKLLEVRAQAEDYLESPPPALVATLDPPITERPGAIIGPYKLLEQIGEGGFGIVFMAEQQQPVRRKVALKVLKPGMDTRQVVARFEAERQALALMDHPNIAKVLDGGQTSGGRPYFVMDLVKGAPVTDYCDQRQLAPRERLELFISVCQAVQHAHLKGIIHRDIKPTNVLVTVQDGAPLVKVIDFGIAKAIGQQLTDKTLFTGFAQLIGSPLYMSPEQAALSNVDVDTRSDIYSLGVLLYELLTGTTPFDKERMQQAGYDEIRRVIREEEPPKPSTRISTLGQAATTISSQRKSDPKRLSQLIRGELDWIVMKCLEKDRNRRYETANGLTRDIERYLHDEPVQACPPSASYRLRKFARRNEGPLLAASFVLLALVGGMIGTVWQAVQATQERNAKQTALDQSRSLSAELAFDKGQLLGETGDPNLALLWLSRSLKLAPPDAVQLQAAIRTNLEAWRRQVNSVRLALPHDGGLYAVGFETNGELLTASWKPGTRTVKVQRWDSASGRLSATQTFLCDLGYWEDGFEPAIVLSPNADSLLIGCIDGTIQLKDLITGKPVWKVCEKNGHAVSAAFSADGKTVLVGYAVGRLGPLRQTGRAQLFDVATGQTLGPGLDHRRPIAAVAFHPDGKSFVTEGGLWGNGIEKVETRFWDLQGHEIRKPLEHTCMAPSVAFSPDGTKLVTGHWANKACLWNLAMPREPVVLLQGGPVLCLAFSPDGQTLLTGSANSSIQLWDGSGTSLGPPLRQGQQPQAARFSPDGKSVLVGTRGNAARLWDLAAAAGFGRSQRQQATYFPLAFSPDRQVILTRDAEHTVQLRDAGTNQPLGMPLPHKHPVLIGGTTVPPSQRQACSSDRRRALTVDADNVARLWDTQAGKLITQLKPVPESTFFAAAFSPDGKLVVTGNMEAAYVWETATGKLIHRLQHEPAVWVFNVAFHPKARMMLLGDSDGVVRFWDTDSGESLGTPLVHDSGVYALTFSPNGEKFLTGDIDQNAYLWDTATRRRLLSLLGHHGCINDGAFSPDDRFVVTGSQDRTARLWDVATGKPIGPPMSHADEVIRVEFAHNGQTLLTATKDQMAQTWPVPVAMTGSAEAIEIWAQVTTGMELEADGGVRILDAAQWQDRRQTFLKIERDVK